MKNMILALLCLYSVNSLATETYHCRDRFNFMSSWYELELNLEGDEVEGVLNFQTSKGIQALHNFVVTKVSSENDESYYRGKDAVIVWKNKRLEFKSFALDRPFSEGFKCEKTGSTISRSDWGKPDLMEVFSKINSPVLLNNGGFREKRHYKRLTTPDGSFDFFIQRESHAVYSYVVKVDLMNKANIVRAQKDLYIVRFNGKNSELMNIWFENFRNEADIPELSMDGFFLRCPDNCYLGIQARKE